MRSRLEWMPAEGGKQTLTEKRRTTCRPATRASSAEAPAEPHSKRPCEGLTLHNFPSRPRAGRNQPESTEDRWDRDPDIWLYRKKTIGLLRRYMRWSLEAGRVPSLLGRELFRARLTANSATTFEARVIFLHDMERCLERLEDFDRQIIARAVLQEHDHESAARLLRCTRKTIERRLPGLIDQLSEAFLDAELLARLPETKEP